MSIASLDQLIAAAKQRVTYRKPTRTTVASHWFSSIDLAGNPGAGTLAGANTANGVVPTDALAGTPDIAAFGAGATGYLSRVEFGSTVACRIRLFDLLFKAGAYAFNASTALASQPSFASRVPNADYSQCELWVEQVTAATGNQAVNVTYTNQAGVAGKTTGAVGIGAAPIVGQCWPLPLAAGDTGVQKVENVAGSVASAGTFNVLVLRPLWSGRVFAANQGDVHDALRTGLPIVYESSALFVLVAPDSTALGVPDLEFDIANG